jgi:hypothetical protein
MNGSRWPTRVGATASLVRPADATRTDSSRTSEIAVTSGVEAAGERLHLRPGQVHGPQLLVQVRLAGRQGERRERPVAPAEEQERLLGPNQVEVVGPADHDVVVTGAVDLLGGAVDGGRAPHTIVAPGQPSTSLTATRRTGVAFEREESAMGITWRRHTRLRRLERGRRGRQSHRPDGKIRAEQHVASLQAVATALGNVIARRADMT